MFLLNAVGSNLIEHMVAYEMAMSRFFSFSAFWNLISFYLGFIKIQHKVILTEILKL